MSRVGTRCLWCGVSSTGKCRDLVDTQAPSWPLAAGLKYWAYGHETRQSSPGVTGVCCSAVGDSHFPNQRSLNSHVPTGLAGGGPGGGPACTRPCSCVHGSLWFWVQV